MFGWAKSTCSQGQSNCVEVGGWRKSRWSGRSACVEAGQGDHVIAVRDTMDRDGTMLTVPLDAWARFTDSLR